jgi:dolichol-phosphate mannosyltransferase
LTPPNPQPPLVIAALPAYNEAESLPPLLEKFAALELPSGRQLRVIVVDDGSTDGTAAVAEAFSDRLKLEVIRHERNRGLGAAIMTGLRRAASMEEASDDAVLVCMDADNTHWPSYIPGMLERVSEGADLVIASRYQRGSKEMGVPALRRVYSRGAKLLFQLTLRLPGVRDYTCGYRAYRLGMVRQALATWGDHLIEGQGFACTDELLVKMARLQPAPQIAEIPFVLRYDLKRGRSKLPLMKTIIATLKLCLLGLKPPPKRGE